MKGYVNTESRHLSPTRKFGDVFIWWEIMPEPNLEGRTKISQMR